MSTVEEIEAAVRSEIVGLLDEEGNAPATLSPSDALLDLGLDSLGLAVLITRLEDALDFDPFEEFEQGRLPRTVGELVELYAAGSRA